VTPAYHLFPRVWRRTLDRPGFAVVPLPAGTGSLALRRAMFDIIVGLNRAAAQAGEPRFVPERLGRFDQQVTTKFHRDGAPPASLLVLGYEPSTVPSRFFVADVCRAAADAGVGVNAFVAAWNPMFPAGEARLRPFVTELRWPADAPAVVVLNNSLFPDDAARPLLGVLHKGEIVAPDPAARRVINSVGLMWEGEPSRPACPADEVARWLTREGLD
jgi:hypothetical protein